MKKKKIIWVLVLPFLVLALTSCSGGSAEPTQDPNVVFTQVAQTVEAGMTQTAEAAPPTATPEPTATQMPTVQPTATLDASQPTATQQQQSFAPTATQQRFGDAAKWNTQSPVDGNVFEEGEQFAFHVCLGNIGSTDWTTDYYLQYQSGYNLWPSNSSFDVGDTVEPGGKWCFDLPSVAPYDSGEYITRWFMKNNEGLSFFEVYFHYYVAE